MSVLVGIHPIREALAAGRPVDRVLISKGAGGPRIQEIVDLCRDRGIPVRFETAEHDVRIEGALVECGPDGRATSCQAVRVEV